MPCHLSTRSQVKFRHQFPHTRRYQNVNWSWGQLPRVSGDYDKLHQVIEESQESTVFETPAQTPVRDAADDGQSGAVTTKLDISDAVNVDLSSVLDQSIPPLPDDDAVDDNSDDVNSSSAAKAVTIAMEKQKTPPGLTLDELERMDPEVKALYLSQPARTDSSTANQTIGKGELRRFA